MGLIGISLIVASVVWVVVRPPPWVLTPLQILLRWRGGNPGAITGPAPGEKAKAKAGEASSSHHEVEPGRRAEPGSDQATTAGSSPSASDRGQRQPPKVSLTGPDHDEPKQQQQQQQRDAVAMPPPPLPPSIQLPTLVQPDEQTTPKAGPVDGPSMPVPIFSLEPAPSANPAPPAPRIAPPVPVRTPAVARGPTLGAGPLLAANRMMPPPPPGRMPAPGSMPPPPSRPPTLAQFPAANSAQRARGPTPNRGLAPPSSGLAPPPTHSAKPSKPSRKVLLTPGHSPLDWARISGPNADLRGVEASTPYLRVTPSMLKRMTGRKGKDAWMALNGKVYNVTPYAEFHPGGVPELMRGAARDATRLFGEVHPWVNYETMLSACLVGLLVEESEVSEMDQMD